jgi:hypothetical protein
MSDREIAQRIYSEKLKSKNPSAFDTMGAFNSAYNADGRNPTSLAAATDFGRALPPQDRAQAQDMFYRQQQVKETQKGPGFWGKLFAGMEKAYNLAAQTVTFGLQLRDENNPLYQSRFNPNAVRQSWDKAREISPGRALVSGIVGEPINLIEDALSAATLGRTRNKTEKFIKDHLLFAANDFNIYDKSQAEEAFREQTYGRFVVVGNRCSCSICCRSIHSSW